MTCTKVIKIRLNTGVSSLYARYKMYFISFEDRLQNFEIPYEYRSILDIGCGTDSGWNLQGRGFNVFRI